MGVFFKKEMNDTDALCQEVMGMPISASDEQVTIDATAGGNENTTAFTLGRLYSFTATVDCYLAFGTSPVTVTAAANYFLPAGQERVFVATYTHCSVIRSVGDGVLFISLLNGGAN